MAKPLEYPSDASPQVDRITTTLKVELQIPPASSNGNVLLYLPVDLFEK